MSALFKKVMSVVLALSWASLASAQTADEVIEKHLAALGGRAALSKVKSRSLTGTIALSTPVGELSGPVEVWNVAPNKSRSLIKLDLSAVADVVAVAGLPASPRVWPRLGLGVDPGHAFF